ncbi:MAG: sulfatase-like hydrolase/transferase, partial [Spirochaetales bacterium]|nr:sulfatase-like hydrolase/transferase [Spirochaetales bacterium]
MPGKPNFLLFVPDGFQGKIVNSDESITPNIDTLASRGLRLTNCHAALPTCSPSRASFMTGVYPHNHGVLQVEHVVADDQSRLRERYPHWPAILADSGYDTGYFGKWHIERTNELERFGWRINGSDEASAFRAIGAGIEETGSLLEGADPIRYIRGPEGYNEVLHYAVTKVEPEERSFHRITSSAIDYVREASSGDKPWACMVSFSEPNTPLVCSKSTFERYDLNTLRMPENGGDGFENAPGFYRRQAGIYSDVSDREWLELRACYMSVATELDAELGRVIEALTETGEIDNTVIIVTGDHGRYLGAHGLDAHNFGAYDEIYNVPFVAAGPGIAENSNSPSHVSLVDLFPTILELASANPPPAKPADELQAIDGRSFADLLKSPDTAAENHTTAMAEYFGTRFLTTQRVLWHDRYKLVFNGFDYDELYDLETD